MAVERNTTVRASQIRNLTIRGQDIADHAITPIKLSEEYVTVSGSRGFSATVSGVYPVEDYHLATKEYVDLVVFSGSVYEPSLGNPASDGYVLSSTAAGLRSWVEMSGGSAIWSEPGTGNLVGGTNAGTEISSGLYNFIGGQTAGRYGDGGHNVLVGYGAGHGVSGNNYDFSVLIGYRAGWSITTGDYNTVIGYEAIYDNTTGYLNVAIGNHAITDNTEGYHNVAVGSYALRTNKANRKSVAIGYSAMYYADNRAVGRDTGNTAIGYEALKGSVTAANNTGQYNVGVGYQPLLNMTAANYNIGIGYRSGYGLTSGSNNVAVGHSSLYATTIGSSNVAIGYNALYNNVANATSVAVGYSAMYYADNRSLGRTTYNTAIGYEALRGSATAANNTGQYNTGVGYQTLYSMTSGLSNSCFGSLAGTLITSGGYNCLFGASAGDNITTGSYNIIIGYYIDPLSATNSNQFAIGTSTYPFLRGDMANYQLAIYGSNGYLNFGTTLGSTGYGFRDNSGVMEFKDSGKSWNPPSPSCNVYIDPFFATRTDVSGSWGLIQAGTIVRACYLKNTSEANGDACSWPFYCGTGTYTLRIALYKSTNLGILDVYIDDVEVASWDNYAATLTWAIQSQAAISMAEGAHTLKLVVDGKNASSSDYIQVIINIMFERTA